jgi:hypothetical protein
MAKVNATSGKVIVCANTANYFRFVGIEFASPTAGTTGAVVELGAGQSSTSALPHHIILDRCYIHGDATNGNRRGVATNGRHQALIDCYVSDIKEVGADNQAVWGYNGDGPFLLHNTYLEAACENVMFGGADPVITGLVPSDITITRCTFYKPLAWIAESWSVKNLLEFKNAQRILVEGCVFENVWASGQIGALLNAKSVNQDGGGTLCVTQDLTFRNNRGINLEVGLQLGGDASEGSTAVAPVRWLFDNNELYVTDVNGGTSYGIFHAMSDARYLTHLIVKHNTFIQTEGRGYHLEYATTRPSFDDGDITDNIFLIGGLQGRDSSEGTDALDDNCTNTRVDFNAWVGRSSANYGAASGTGNVMANNLFPANTAAVDFVNYAGGNYRLNVTSPLYHAASDGTDVGADIDAIEAAIAGEAEGEPAGTALYESEYSSMQAQTSPLTISRW